MSYHSVLAIVGGLAVVYHLLKLVWSCCCGLGEFVLSAVWQADLTIYGKWAVVTGATSGIGKAYAIELARRGLDVVLVSRCSTKLQNVAKQIEGEYGRKTRTIQADFTDGDSVYPAIAQGLHGLEIGILVNNVGMMYSENFSYFLEVPNAEQKITQLVNCNMLSVPQMTRLVLPQMVKRGRGLVVNISSATGNHPQPLLSLYSATKIFVTIFSRCLHAEYKSKGITVQCVAPVMVSTNMTNIRASCLVKGSAQFAREALNTVGYSSHTSGCLSHALQNALMTLLLPDSLRMSSVLIRSLSKLAPPECRMNGKERL